MGKTIRQLERVLEVTAVHILAVSREDTDKAFKVTIDALKAYILDADGYSPAFTDLTVDTLNSEGSPIEIYVNNTILSALIDENRIGANRFTSSDVITTYIALGSSLDLVVGEFVVASFSGTQLLTDSLKSLTTSVTRIDFASSFIFLYPSTYPDPIIGISADNSTLDIDSVGGISEPYKIDLLNTDITVYADTNEAIIIKDDGHVELPGRHVIVACTNDVSVPQTYPTVYTPLKPDVVIIDTTNTYNPADGTFTWPVAGVELEYYVQVTAALSSFINSTSWIFKLSFQGEGESETRRHNGSAGTYRRTDYTWVGFTSTDDVGASVQFRPFLEITAEYIFLMIRAVS